MRSKLFVRLVVVCYLPGLQNAPFCLTMTKKIIGITRSTYDLLKTIEFIKNDLEKGMKSSKREFISSMLMCSNIQMR